MLNENAFVEVFDVLLQVLHVLQDRLEQLVESLQKLLMLVLKFLVQLGQSRIGLDAVLVELLLPQVAEVH